MTTLFYPHIQRFENSIGYKRSDGCTVGMYESESKYWKCLIALSYWLIDLLTHWLCNGLKLWFSDWLWANIYFLSVCLSVYLCVISAVHTILLSSLFSFFKSTRLKEQRLPWSSFHSIVIIFFIFSNNLLHATQPSQKTSSEAYFIYTGLRDANCVPVDVFCKVKQRKFLNIRDASSPSLLIPSLLLPSFLFFSSPFSSLLLPSMLRFALL